MLLLLVVGLVGSSSSRNGCHLPRLEANGPGSNISSSSTNSSCSLVVGLLPLQPHLLLLLQLTSRHAKQQQQQQQKEGVYAAFLLLLLEEEATGYHVWVGQQQLPRDSGSCGSSSTGGLCVGRVLATAVTAGEVLLGVLTATTSPGQLACPGGGGDYCSHSLFVLPVIIGSHVLAPYSKAG
jgi:hypothetical protein